MVRTRCPKIPSPAVVGILVALALSWTRAGWMVSKVGAMLGECMARIFLMKRFRVLLRRGNREFWLVLCMLV